MIYIYIYTYNFLSSIYAAKDLSGFNWSSTRCHLPAPSSAAGVIVIRPMVGILTMDCH